MGLAGFLFTALPVLWLGLGGVELAHWMQLRQSLSLVLIETARVGATRQADPRPMALAFERGLRTIYPAEGEPARILAERRRNLGLPWHIAIQRPTPEAFTDHADPELQGTRAYRGQALIRNEGQPRQHAARMAQGWPQGRGPASGLTIFEANTLRLALQWPHRPLLPGMAALIKGLAPWAQEPRSRQWMAAGYLPFHRQVTVAMQSPPAAWPDLPDGRITHEARAGAPFRPLPGMGPPDAATEAGTPAGTPPVGRTEASDTASDLSARGPTDASPGASPDAAGGAGTSPTDTQDLRTEGDTTTNGGESSKHDAPQGCEPE
ncbi:hypothetical protein CDEF62S_03118 [Castellaniella defragrans]